MPPASPDPQRLTHEKEPNDDFAHANVLALDYEKTTHITAHLGPRDRDIFGLPEMDEIIANGYIILGDDSDVDVIIHGDADSEYDVWGQVSTVNGVKFFRQGMNGNANFIEVVNRGERSRDYELVLALTGVGDDRYPVSSIQEPNDGANDTSPDIVNIVTGQWSEIDGSASGTRDQDLFRIPNDHDWILYGQFVDPDGKFDLRIRTASGRDLGLLTSGPLNYNQFRILKDEDVIFDVQPRGPETAAAVGKQYKIELTKVKRDADLEFPVWY